MTKSRFSHSPHPRPALAAVLFLAAILWPLSAGDSQAEDVLTFGTYAADKPSTVVRTFRPILGVLEKRLRARLGKPIKIRTQIYRSYDDAIAALAKGEIDFARFGPASYVNAKAAAPGINILAVEAVKGKKVFYGIICVHEDSDIARLHDLRGRSFAFGAQMSTIGRYLSQHFLMKAGLTAKHLGRIAYLGRHDKVGTAVAKRDFDAGALKESTFHKLRKKGFRIRALARFPNVTKPWIARPGLPPHLRTTLRQILLDIRDKKALKGLKKSGFLPGEDRDFDSIRAAMKESANFYK